VELFKLALQTSYFSGLKEKSALGIWSTGSPR
jgi:hypothetical protein